MPYIVLEDFPVHQLCAIAARHKASNAFAGARSLHAVSLSIIGNRGGKSNHGGPEIFQQDLIKGKLPEAQVIRAKFAAEVNDILRTVYVDTGNDFSRSGGNGYHARAVQHAKAEAEPPHFRGKPVAPVIRRFWI